MANRRSFLKAAGATGAAAATGGIGILAVTGSSVAASFTISSPNAVTTNDGSIDYVRLQAEHQATWDGFDTDVHYAKYFDDVTVRPNSDNETYRINTTVSDDLSQWSDEGSSDGWGGDDEYTSGVGKAGYVHAGIDWNVIGASDETLPSSEGGARSIEDPAAARDLLEPDADGETKESTVVVTKTVRFLDKNRNPLTGPNGQYDDAVAEDSFTVTVTNETGTTGATGNGSTGIGATDTEP